MTSLVKAAQGVLVLSAAPGVPVPAAQGVLDFNALMSARRSPRDIPALANAMSARYAAALSGLAAASSATWSAGNNASAKPLSTAAAPPIQVSASISL